jgi:hypothetical protein
MEGAEMRKDKSPEGSSAKDIIRDDADDENATGTAYPRRRSLRKSIRKTRRKGARR